MYDAEIAKQGQYCGLCGYYHADPDWGCPSFTTDEDEE